jgi:hypothetical protein
VPDGEADELAALEARRAELYVQLSEVSDFRRGSLNAVYRKCGKPNCACAAPCSFPQFTRGPQVPRSADSFPSSTALSRASAARTLPQVGDDRLGDVTGKGKLVLGPRR